MNEIELMLKLDNQVKRRTGSGVYHRASRKGFIRGGIKTQYDYLTRKEKRNLNGDVVVSNRYSNIENIPTFEEMKLMSLQDAQNIMKILITFHSKTKIAKKWGIGGSKFYGYLAKIGLYERKDGRYVEVKNNDIPNNKQVKKELAVSISNENETKNSFGFQITFNNVVTCEEAENRLLSFSSILNKEKKYKISLQIAEID